MVLGPLEQGAGVLNIEGAMRLASSVRQDLASPVHVGLPLLTGSVTASSSFCGQQFHLEHYYSFASSIRCRDPALITRFQGPYATGELLGDGFLISDGLIINKGLLLSGTNQLVGGDSLWTSQRFRCRRSNAFRRHTHVRCRRYLK